MSCPELVHYCSSHGFRHILEALPGIRKRLSDPPCLTCTGPPCSLQCPLSLPELMALGGPGRKRSSGKEVERPRRSSQSEVFYPTPNRFQSRLVRQHRARRTGIGLIQFLNVAASTLLITENAKGSKRPSVEMTDEPGGSFGVTIHRSCFSCITEHYEKTKSLSTSLEL